MQVQVQPLKSRGALRPAEALRAELPLQGELSMRERKDYRSGRTLRIEGVVEQKDALEQDLLPELMDAQVLGVKGDELTVAGYERVDGQDFAQSWSVRLS